MSAASRMILWQLWRQTRGETALLILGQFGILCLMLLVAYTRLSAMFHLMMPVFFMLSFFVALAAIAMVSLLAGGRDPRNPMPFPLHLDYAQPVSTATLVFLTMAHTCVKAAAVYLAVALPVHFGLGQPMPLLPYVYWLMVMAAVLQAVLWVPATTGGRAWGYILGVGGVSLLFLKQVFIGPGGTDNLLETPEPLKGLFAFTPAGYLGLGLLAIGAFAVAVASVERQRHGEALLPRLRSGRVAPAPSPRRSMPRFSSPIRAQIWCEARRALITPLLFPLLATASMILVSVLTLPIPDEVELDLMAVLWVFLVVGTFFSTHLLTGHLSGALRFRGGAWSYSTFEATLPMGTGRLTLIKIGTVLASGALAAAMLAIGTALAILPHLGQEQWTGALGELFREFSKWWQSISLLGRFGLVYFFALWVLSFPLLLFSFAEAGVAYPRRLNVILTLCVADILLAAVLLLLRLPFHLYAWANAWAMAAMAIGGTIWAVYRALERGYLDKRLFGTWAILWALSVGIWFATASHLPVQLGFRLALLLLPLLAVVLPPLALAANRHR